MRVLVADDDPVSRRAVVRLLQARDYEVVEAGNGDDAWKILRGQGRPRLAILDWVMPGMDGIEVCRRLRDQEGGAYVYTVLLTSRTARADQIIGFENGADDYLNKPVDAGELIARLRAGSRILELEETLLGVQAELEFKATHDPLTGLLNHGQILAGLEREHGRARRNGTWLSLLMGDLDHFKGVNDHFGHRAGDAVLVEVAKRLTSGLRVYDDLGRYGGEEFLLVLPDCNPNDAWHVAERLRSAIAARPITFEGASIPVTLSLGMCSAKDRQLGQPAQLLQTVDELLYEAKAAGRDQVASRIVGEGDDERAPAPSETPVRRAS